MQYSLSESNQEKTKDFGPKDNLLLFVNIVHQTPFGEKEEEIKVDLSYEQVKDALLKSPTATKEKRSRRKGAANKSQQSQTTQVIRRKAGIKNDSTPQEEPEKEDLFATLSAWGPQKTEELGYFGSIRGLRRFRQDKNNT